MTGVPTSATSSARNSSCSATMAAWSWRRHRWRKARSVDHAGRRRRPAGRRRWPGPCRRRWRRRSGRCTSSVAGLMLSKPAPADARPASPSISIRNSLPRSDCVFEEAVVVMTLPGVVRSPVVPAGRRRVDGTAGGEGHVQSGPLGEILERAWREGHFQAPEQGRRLRDGASDRPRPTGRSEMGVCAIMRTPISGARGAAHGRDTGGIRRRGRREPVRLDGPRDGGQPAAHVQDAAGRHAGDARGGRGRGASPARPRSTRPSAIPRSSRPTPTPWTCRTTAR